MTIEQYEDKALAAVIAVNFTGQTISYGQFAQAIGLATAEQWDDNRTRIKLMTHVVTPLLKLLWRKYKLDNRVVDISTGKPGKGFNDD